MSREANAFRNMLSNSLWLDQAMRGQLLCDISKSGLLAPHLLGCKVNSSL